MLKSSPCWLKDAPIQVKARRLVDRAISKGGSDNITVALISPAA